MEEIKLVAEKRDGKSTKLQLSTLRGGNRIPAVIYGGEKESIEIALSAKDLLEVRKKGGLNAIVHLQVGSTTETVIVKELQRHPVTDKPVHADFQRISLTQKIEARVPLHVVGEAPGVKHQGGVMQFELRELRVRALPTKIPQSIEVNVNGVELNGHMQVKDLTIPAEVEVLDKPEAYILHVSAVKEEVAEVVPGAAVAAVEGAVPAEPELAATKGKKDEEGKVIPKDVKAAPAAEKGKEPGKKEGK